MVARIFGRWANLYFGMGRRTLRFRPSSPDGATGLRGAKQFCESRGKADAIYGGARPRAPALIARGKRRTCAGLNRANNRNRDRSLNARRKTGEPRATQYHRGGSILVRAGIAGLNEATQNRARIARDLIP